MNHTRPDRYLNAIRAAFSLLLALPVLAHALTSPDGQIQVDVRVNAQQHLVYSLQRAGQPVVLESRLGLVLENAELANGLSLVASSAVKPHHEHYTLLTGKRSQVNYRANEQHFTVVNALGRAGPGPEDAVDPARLQRWPGTALQRRRPRPQTLSRRIDQPALCI